MSLREEVAAVAYEIYERSGQAHGRDLEHWLEAESIVTARLAVPDQEQDKGKQPSPRTSSKRDAETKTSKVKSAGKAKG